MICRNECRFITVFVGVLLLFAIFVWLAGCDYQRGIIRPGDVNRFIEDHTAAGDIACLADEDGAHTFCFMAVPGPKGADGRDGVSIVGPVGPQGIPGVEGEQGADGQPGRDGVDGTDGIDGRDAEDGRDGEDGAYVVVVTPYLRLQNAYQSFVMEISQGIPKREADLYITPVATVSVPQGGGEIVVTPRRRSSQPTQSGEPVYVADEPVSVTPVVNVKPSAKGIWHVMYRVEGRKAHIYVYPRERDIQTTPPLGISLQFNIEMQGTRESVNSLLQSALAEDGVTLGSVGGTQGVIDQMSNGYLCTRM